MFQTCSFENSMSASRSLGVKSETVNQELPQMHLDDIIQKAADSLRSRIKEIPKIAILSELDFFEGPLMEILENPIVIPYFTIPHFFDGTTTNEVGKLVSGKISNVKVLCMIGRLHLYDGYPLWKCTLPIRIMKNIGIEKLIISNTADGINANFSVGDIMVIKDHIDLVRLFGDFSLSGPAEDLFHFKYRPVNIIYNNKMIDTSIDIGKEIGLEGNIHRGVYTFSMGPNGESNADKQLLKVLGTDAVGDFSVHEAIVAKDSGMLIFAFSLITSTFSSDYEEECEIDKEKVLDIEYKIKSILKEFLCKIIRHIDRTTDEHSY